ncbi:MAG: helix-turn-helix domain-containing protein [Victivallales bacterium]|jgi:transcriptional regulator with XRE-family HTH domain|nr:helix-turn-helix domain-containing protein [Victivallales bacterium]
MSLKKMYDFSILRSLRKRENLNIADVSDRSGVSASVISKLERNQTAAELETLYKLSRVFGMSTSDLIALAESQMAQRTHSRKHVSESFTFNEISYGNIRALHGSASAGGKVSRPQLHRDDYEVCWVLKGKMFFYLPGEKLELNCGDAVQFDALLEHTYEAVEDCEILLLHIRKGNRF